MRILVMLGGYIIVPLAVALFFRLLKVQWVFISYFITAIVIYFYPYFQFEMEYYLATPQEAFDMQSRRCGTGQSMMWLANLVCFLPATLMIQLLFNYLFTRAFFIKKTVSPPGV